MIYCVYLVWNAVVFCLYGYDKLQAKRHAWRVPEKVLLLTGFFGGGVGALVGMEVWRHKTKHTYFWVINLLGLIWQLACLYYFR